MCRPPALAGSLLQAPPAGPVADAATSAIERINTLLAGNGVDILRSCAWFATQIRTVLDDPSLPAAVGSANRDQMVRSLNLAITPAHLRLEDGLVQFSLALIGLPELANRGPSPELLRYITSLHLLSGQIPWGDFPTNCRR